MAAPSKQHYRRNPSIWRSPHIETLETRLPFATDLSSGDSIGAYVAADQNPRSLVPALNVHQGPTQSGAPSLPITITGFNEQQYFDAHPITLADGGHLLIMRTTDAGITKITGRLTDHNGIPGPAPFTIAYPTITTWPSTPQDTPWQLYGVELNDGSIVAIWSDEIGIYRQRFDPTGQLLGASTQLTSISATSHPQLASLALNDGSYLVGWYDSDSNALTVQQFDAAGALLQSYDLGSLSFTGSIRQFWMELDTNQIPIAVWSIEDGLGNSSLHWQLVSGTTTTANKFELFGLSQIDAIMTRNGTWAITGIRSNGSDIQAVLVTLDATGAPLSERSLATVSTQSDPPEIQRLSNGEWIVNYFQTNTGNLELAYQWFSASGEPLGTPQALKATISDSRGILLPLSNNTLVAYWSGYALNGVDHAIMAQNIGLHRTSLFFGIDERLRDRPDDELALIIRGLPQDAGLSEGSLQNDGSWIVGLDQLDGLEILSYSRPANLNLEVSLVAVQDPETILHTQPNLFGSESDDVFSLLNGHSHIDGRQGNDTVSILGFSDGFVGTRINEHAITFESIDRTFSALLEEIESLEFLDGTFDVDAFLERQAADEPEEFDDEEFDNDDDGDEPTLPPVANSTQEEITDTIDAATDSTDGDIWESFADSNDSLTSFTTFEFAALSGQFENNWASAFFETTSSMPNNVLQTSITPSLIVTPSGSLETRLQPPRPGDSEHPVRPVSIAPLTAKTSSDESIEHESESIDVVTEEIMLTSAVLAATSMNSANMHEATATAALGNTADRARTMDWQVGIDLNRRVRFGASEQLTVSAAFNGRALMETMDEATEAADDTSLKPVIVGSAIVLATGFSVAQIVWLMRGSALLTKTLSSAPLWIAFDPLPIVNPEDGETIKDASPQNSETLLDIAQARS